MASINELVTSYPLGQKRTKNWAVMVGGEVWKGPMKEERLTWIEYVTDALSQVNSVVLATRIQLLNDGSLWVVYPSLSGEQETEPYVDKRSGLHVNIIKRSGWVKLSDVLYPEIDNVTDLLFTMVLAYTIGVGDLGLYNVLYSQEERRAVLIDYEDEDRRPFDPKEEWFYFTKRPRAELLNPWLEKVRPHYGELARRLGELEETERVRAVLNHLSNYMKVELPVWGGPFHGTFSRSNVPLDVLKSGLQKYIRRADEQQAEIYAYEWYEIGQLPNASSTLSNLVNRLATIAMEDVGIANWEIGKAIVSWIRKGVYDLPTILHWVRVASRSPKTRLCSHLMSAGRTGYYTELPESILDDTIDWTESEKAIQSPFIKMVNMFFLRVRQRKNSFVFWLDQLVQIEGVEGITRGRRKSWWSVIWHGLKRLSNELEDLEWFFYKRSEKERPYWVVFAVLRLFYPERSTLPELTGEIPGYLTTGEYKLRIDEFVVDKHTSSGARSGKTRKEFVKDGAFVTPECPRFTSPELKRWYEEH